MLTYMRNIANCLGSPWLAMAHVPVLLAVVGMAGVSLAAAALIFRFKYRAYECW